MRLISIVGPLLALGPSLAFAAPNGQSDGPKGLLTISNCRDDCTYYKDDGNAIHACIPYTGGREKYCVKFPKDCPCKNNEDCKGKNSICWYNKCAEFVNAKECGDGHKDCRDWHGNDCDCDDNDCRGKDCHNGGKDCRGKDGKDCDCNDKDCGGKDCHNGGGKKARDGGEKDCKDRHGKDCDCDDNDCRGRDCHHHGGGKKDCKDRQGKDCDCKNKDCYGRDCYKN